MEFNLSHRGKNIIAKSVVGPFYPTSLSLAKDGFVGASLEDGARLRIANADNFDFLNIGHWVNNTAFYVYSSHKKKFYITKFPLWATMEKPITRAYKENRDYSLLSEQLNSYLLAAVEIKDSKIPTIRLGDCRASTFLFGSVAEEYGYLLHSKGIEDINFLFDESQIPFGKKGIAKPIWFRGLNNNSDIFCNGKNGIFKDKTVLGIKYLN